MAAFLCSPDRDRTCILGSGNLHTIHCTTGPKRDVKVVKNEEREFDYAVGGRSHLWCTKYAHQLF